MTRFILEDAKKPDPKGYDAPRTEAEAAYQLLERHGYNRRRAAATNGQWEFDACPFHEQPGVGDKKSAPNFYVNVKTSQFYCFAGHCGEQGNLQTLEHYFGVDNDPVLAGKFQSKNAVLQGYEANMGAEQYKFFLKEKGLNSETVARFRIGWDRDREIYVIPYLESRRPVAFRYYDPTRTKGPKGSKYWWENSADSIAPPDDGVLRLFNASAANGDKDGMVLIAEGEAKCALLTQWGFSAVGIPGVNGLKPEWAKHFMHAKDVVILMDNDNPDNHAYEPCLKCANLGETVCQGHNPGQEGAAKLLDFFGYRARNVVLPIPDGAPKTDINEYVMRDGHQKHDFVRLLSGEDRSEYAVRTLGEIRNDPPPETMFLVDQLLPVAGRLLITGAPKTGKSVLAENLVLSLASGIPFLHRFNIANNRRTAGHRVLLLDRELSERSLFDRFNQLIKDRPGYGVADDKLLIDYRYQLALDVQGAADNLIGLIRENNAEVVVLDTAYKFFSNGDMESSRSLSKSFAAIDKAIRETGASFVLTHHHRKGSNDRNEMPSADSVVGSFLWTGWANATVLLNFKNRSVADPYTVIASFVAFRDTAAPEPLLLKRGKESISYQEILPYSFDEVDKTTDSYTVTHARPKLSYDTLADLLIQTVPIDEAEFLHVAAAHFGMKPANVKLTLLDIGDNHKDFVREGDGGRTKPSTWRYNDKVEELYVPPFDGQTTLEEMLAA